ncbi:iron-sulfur cluster assembly scaffold protein [Planctomycetota bacterium]
MRYTDKVFEHFMNPRNIGEIPDADGVGTIGSEECGDMIWVWIKVNNEHLADIKYKVFGCPAAIASCSMMTELAMGKHVDDAYEITNDQVAHALGGLPAHKYHCSNLAASVLHKAIMNYVFKNPAKIKTSTITILVDNNASGNFQSERGLSLLLEYQDKRVLFDTGRTDLILRNAELLDVNLADTHAIVISHGHYDHTGGLKAVLNIASEATLYLHPEALKPKFSRKDNKTSMSGIPKSTKKIIHALADKGRVAWTEMPTEVFPGLFITSRIPRITDYEDVGGDFFLDSNCNKPDTLLDDQAMFFDSPKGLAILLGCAHAGVVNTLHYIAGLSREKNIYAVIGGMHLINASSQRIERTIEAFKQYDVKKIGLAHCTGNNAVEKFKDVFPSRCFMCSVSTRIELGN